MTRLLDTVTSRDPHSASRECSANRSFKGRTEWPELQNLQTQQSVPLVRGSTANAVDLQPGERLWAETIR